MCALCDQIHGSQWVVALFGLNPRELFSDVESHERLCFSRDWHALSRWWQKGHSFTILCCFGRSCKSVHLQKVGVARPAIDTSA